MLLYRTMHTQLLPYQKNTTELFDHFVHLPNAILLDSCKPSPSQGRYDIITADPIHLMNESHTIFSDIQNQLSQLKNRIRNNNAYPLPFTIGAMGYLSYDVARTLEKIPSIAADDIPLPAVVVGIYDWSIVVDHVEKKIFLTTVNTETQQKILTLLKTKPRTQKKFSLTRKFKSNMTETEYHRAFAIIKKNIVAGNCYQVNLAQRFSAEFVGSPWCAYKILREKNPAPYSAFLSLENDAILSCSPERFLKVANSLVETKPIKGTAKRFSDSQQDQQSAENLLHSEKDRAENVMIVDLLRNDLSRTCTDITVQRLCALESFPTVHHLVSTITGKLLPQKTAIDLLEKCFPGGSITGAPKIAAMKIIESLEPHRRSVYCGSIFYADITGNVDSNILIRTAVCNQQKIHCYAGGGIVYDSECEKEYREIHMKIKNIIQILSHHG